MNPAKKILFLKTNNFQINSLVIINDRPKINFC